MNRYSTTAICLVAAFAASACSTKPRQFSAQVRPVAATQPQTGLQQTERAAYTTCDQMVRHGRKSGFASAAATSGAGVAGMAGGAGLAFTGLGGGSLASAGATAAAAMPIVGFFAAFGMNRAIRGGREKGYRKHMTTCMDEMGYQVVDWSRAPKKQSGTAMLVPATEAHAVAEAEAIAPVPASDIRPVSSEGEASASLVTAGPAD
ncbi:hypothetical protein A6F68_00604 [Tsuneonella dongtanensis]|uniref:Lipoprotein n=1 Tax=Tsuneonella dongtanensis TaxID=692370 RepID=A0A1B2AAE9_9SPHN|nr:hypothetical protein [Tsuneonella dongtanensis]ANY19137.1 hypothetical protein A6F68_00604 [Tsuneonella dongtanensis]